MSAPGSFASLLRRYGGPKGIHLVRRMMDEVSYHRRDDRNVVVLGKRLRAG